MVASEHATIDYQSEVLRKAIHLCSLSIPVIYYFITKELALKILIPLLILSLIIDLGRYYFKPIQDFFYSIFGFLLRRHEKDHKKKNLNGATYVLISAVIVILIFPKIFVVTSFSILIIGDIAAALVGRKFGKRKFLLKSLEGTIAFFLFSCIVILFTPKIEGNLIEFIIGFVSAGIGAIAENISIGWADDNLVIPITVGISMWILYTIFLPHMPLVLPNVPN
ncbi:MAG: dolichol kinase [Melioribacter sp.]|uniref:diacylglycerol/polyprenol kinase family protein n=1 Tax=Rosettibacter primus TaxID=3111523 RepID=UPI00247CCAEF|nr:dolichol kinase [Melioribacter sp.]